jgi:hypothetical protein
MRSPIKPAFPQGGFVHSSSSSEEEDKRRTTDRTSGWTLSLAQYSPEGMSISNRLTGQ